MLLAGDEMGHTQDGNNNTYCQDNEIDVAELGCQQAQTESAAAWISSAR